MGAIKNLKEYIELDDVVVDKTEESDFSKFCSQHCQDIDEVVTALEEVFRIIRNLDDNDFDNYHDYQIVYAYYQKIYDEIKYVLD